MSKDDIELPPLPKPAMNEGDTALYAAFAGSQLTDYALAAIEPYQQRIEELESQLEAIGAGGVSSQRITSQRGGEPDFFTYVINGNHRGISETEPPADSYDEGTLRALYATPQPAEPKGCQNLSMGEHACSDPSQCWEPCGELGKSTEHAKAAEPVKVPSDVEIMAEFPARMRYEDDPRPIIKSVRAVLARYGHPVEPEGWQLVPKEPTEEMLIGAMVASLLGRPSTDDDSYVRSIVAAWCEAAPKFGETEMTHKHDGGPAFPHNRLGSDHDGMSLRDFFAAEAMQGLIASPDTTRATLEQIVSDSYRIADEMIKARGKGE